MSQIAWTAGYFKKESRNEKVFILLETKENKMEQLNQVVEAKRQSQVQEQVSNLEGNLTALHSSIGNLVDRLSSVLRSSIPSEAEKGQDRMELVNLACTIEDFGDSVKSANYKIEDILERIEL